MPITGVLDLQRRSLPLGEIRIGESEPIPGKRGRKPIRRETFRFTTPSEETAHAIADRLGGAAAPWDRRRGYWVVDTDVARLDVWVPPRGLAVDAWMEMWDDGRCRRRCDGITEQRSGRPCMCPQPDDRSDPAQVAAAAAERKRLAALKPAQGCKPLTRINLAIPWLPGVIGVWRLNTGSANAAVETADSGEVLERARSMDVYLPALLLIHWRPGQDGHPYPVPVLRPRPSAEQLAELPAGMDGMLAQIGTGPMAITSGAPKRTESDETAPQPPTPSPDPEPGRPPSPVTARKLADLVMVSTSRDELAEITGQAKDAGQLGILLEIDGAHEYLRDLIQARWDQLPARQTANTQRQAAEPEGGSLFDSDPAWEAQ